MQTEILTLVGVNGDGCAAKVTNALQTINGVREVIVSVAGSTATVQFDENLTSSQELNATLKRAGYGADSPKKPEHGSGSCCGACGGNNH